MSSFTAISVCVMPLRCCRRTMEASSAGRASIARRTCHTASSVSSSGREGHHRRVVRGDLGECNRRPARLAAVDVDRGVLRDRRQPRPGIAVDVETVGGLPRAHERLLHCLLGEIVAAEHAVRDRVGEPPVLAIQRSNRVRLAPSECAQHGGPRDHRLRLALLHLERRHPMLPCGMAGSFRAAMYRYTDTLYSAIRLRKGL